MKSSTRILVGIVAVVMVVFWIFGTRNNLLTLKEDVKMQQAQIQRSYLRGRNRGSACPYYEAADVYE